MVPDTVQLMVLVAGLCCWAPALEVMRPAGMAAQRPQEALVPVAALLLGGFGVGQGAGHALVGAIDVGVQGLALLGLQPVLLVPDVLGRRLHGDQGGLFRLDRLEAHRTHGCVVLLKTTGTSLMTVAGGPGPAPVSHRGPGRRGRRRGPPHRMRCPDGRIVVVGPDVAVLPTASLDLMRQSPKAPDFPSAKPDVKHQCLGPLRAGPQHLVSARSRQTTPGGAPCQPD